MAQRRKRPQRNKLLDEQIREHRARVECQARDEYLRQCALIAESIRNSNLTLKQVAALAGLSYGTVKNIVHAKRKSINQDSINRLRSIPQLKLPIAIDTGSQLSIPGYQSIWLPSYNPNDCAELLQLSLKWRRNKLPYVSLQHSKTSTDLYQLYISCGAYGEWIKQARHDVAPVVACLYKLISGQFEAICLTIGHGWSELKLAETLILDESNRLSKIWLVSPNVHLLSHGLYVYNKQMHIPEKNGDTVGLVLGHHEDFINNLPSRSSQKRVFLLFGTLINHDSCGDLLNLISHKSNFGDVLIFDAHFPFGEPSNRNVIMDNDPRLSGKLPLSYVESLEKMFDPAIREIDATISGIEWSYEIENAGREAGSNLESYSVDMRAKIFREHTDLQNVSVLRIRRHSPVLLEKYLSARRWTLIGNFIQGQLPEINYPSRILVFVKHG